MIRIPAPSLLDISPVKGSDTPFLGFVEGMCLFGGARLAGPSLSYYSAAQGMTIGRWLYREESIGARDTADSPSQTSNSIAPTNLPDTRLDDFEQEHADKVEQCHEESGLDYREHRDVNSPSEASASPIDGIMIANPVKRAMPA